MSFYHLFQYIIIGDSGCGKSSLARQFTSNLFELDHIATIGVDFESRTIDIHNDSIKIQIWDTAGQESFRSITRSYYRRANVVFLVYDITDLGTFQHIPNWLDEIGANSHKDIIIVLVGNKKDSSDNRRQVPTLSGNEFAKRNNLLFFETSAKNATDVEYIFVETAKKALLQKKQRIEAGNKTNVIVKEKMKSSVKSRPRCCV